MIDDPGKTDLLISTLKESLPIQANITRYLSDALTSRSPDITIPKKCNVVSIFYAGKHGRYSLRPRHRRRRDQNATCGFHNSSDI
jgi:hypothetical protein